MLWALVLLPSAGAVLLFAVARGGRRTLTGAVLAVMGATLALALAALWGWWPGSTYAWSLGIVLQLGLSPAGAVFAPMVPLVAAPILAFAALHEPMGPHAGLARLLALMTLFVAAMELLVLAADLLTLLLGWELVGACSWALIGHRWRAVDKPCAAAWAFLTTRAGDLGLYLAAAVLFAGTGSFAYSAIAELDGIASALFAGGVLLAAAAKSAQLPFSPWLFAAMAGPAPVSALLHAATMVAAGVFLLVRLYDDLAALAWFGPATLALGLATALAAGLVACVQGHAKRVLAASTSAHYGLMWVALGAGYPAVALLHFVAHAVLKAPLFLALAVVGRRAGGYRLETLAAVQGGPLLAGAALAASLALAGVVPLGAAWSKEQVVAAAGHGGPGTALLVAVAGAFSAAYATRLQLLAFGLPRPGAKGGAAAERWPIAALAGLTAVSSLLWWPGLGERIAARLGMALPGGAPWALPLSLLSVAAGILAGAWLARRRPFLDGRPPSVAGWFGLPRLAARVVVAPVTVVARTLAWFDDLGHGRLVHAAAATTGLASGLARFDDAVVDAGLRASARCGAWLAAFADRVGEPLCDALACATARAVGRGGRAARQLQSGLTHQYYVLIAAGLGGVIVLLLLGGLP